MNSSGAPLDSTHMCGPGGAVCAVCLQWLLLLAHFLCLHQAAERPAVGKDRSKELLFGRLLSSIWGKPQPDPWGEAQRERNKTNRDNSF